MRLVIEKHLLEDSNLFLFSREIIKVESFRFVKSGSKELVDNKKVMTAKVSFNDTIFIEIIFNSSVLEELKKLQDNLNADYNSSYIAIFKQIYRVKDTKLNCRVYGFSFQVIHKA